jgi:hypothetical protein
VLDELAAAVGLVEPPELLVPVELVAAATVGAVAVATGVDELVPVAVGPAATVLGVAVLGVAVLGVAVLAAVVPAAAGLSSTNCVRAASSAENRVPPPEPSP